MAKKIVSVGMLLASDEVTEVEFNSKASLLDYDIILFRPNIDEFFVRSGGERVHKGKPSLDDRNSFALKEACEHWRREIKDAIGTGKTAIVHLSEPKEVFVQTGNKRISGTGRNQISTNILEPFQNYQSLPVKLIGNASRGREVLVCPEWREFLSAYWDKFGVFSTYQVTFKEADKYACLVTKNGSKPVGLHFGDTSGLGGNLLLLPDMNFDDDRWFEKDEDEEGYFPFTKEAQQFAASYIAEIVALDRRLRLASEHTAEPEWAKVPIYLMAAESRLRKELLLAEQAVENAQRMKEELKTELIEASMLRGLLYETGKPLEAAVLKALQILGFKAENFADESSEFDAVFSSDEGRLLGEAEGKDNKAINITKLRQLTMNIDEDFGRDEVVTRAKGVLFGNAYRLTDPDNRDTPFSDKCITSATAQSIALVHTPELFKAARHVLESEDCAFATLCREVLVGTIGIVTFPAVPEGTDAADQVDAPETTASEGAGGMRS